MLKKHFISAFSFVLPSTGCGVLFKQISNVKMKYILKLGKILTYIRKHAKWAQITGGKIVSSKNMDKFAKTRNETYQKSVQENKNKEPLF